MSQQKLLRKVNEWNSMFQEEMICSNFLCPDFEMHMQVCIQELLRTNTHSIVFKVVQPLFASHGIQDTVGATYWFMRNYYRNIPHKELPNIILCHTWVAQHHLYGISKSHKLQLELEKKHVEDIATWCEMHYIRSEIRHQIRRIDRALCVIVESQ